MRSTNVYEDQSLGIFRLEDKLAAAEYALMTDGSRMAMWGRYLTLHARYQLSFGASSFYLARCLHLISLVKDMWWLAMALFLVCIIEV